VRATTADVQRDLENESPQRILSWALDRYRSRIALACSFGGPSGMVLLDMTLAIDPATPVFYLDTGLLFPETLALVERVAKRYGIAPIAVKPRLSVEEQNAAYGDALWQRDPDACCNLRKVESMRRFLDSYDAWITAIRRDQTPQRMTTPVVQDDAIFGLVKINPLARWSEETVWTYLRAHALEYNELHDAGYFSVGCVPCTRPVEFGEPIRAGRWPQTGKTECGLHARPSRAER
jgi:phosphoadenosine phosphosulfate reductase